MNAKPSIPCPEAESPVPASPPFSPLGWSVWLRVSVAAGASILLWAVVLWVLD